VGTIVAETRSTHAYFGVDAVDTGKPSADVIEDGKRIRIRPTGPVGGYLLMPLEDWHLLVATAQEAIDEHAKVVTA
jgi:hypothetical protein